MRTLVGWTRIALLSAASALAIPNPAGAGASPSPAPAPPRRVVLLGLDGADWTLLDPLLAAGKMPNLARVIASGRSAILKSELPFLSPIIWTTIATGVAPSEHGVLDFEEFDPADGSRVPISTRSRDFPAIWSTASAKGLDVGVVGWWASWPCERLRGFCVADRFAPALYDAPADGPGIVFPESQAPRLAKMREEETLSARRDFRAVFGFEASQARSLGPVGEKAAEGLERILAQSRIFVRVAVSLGERVSPALLAVYLSGTDEVGHVAARWHPPRLDGIPESEFRLLSGAVTGFYAEADRLIGVVAAHARSQGATLMIVSDHGFLWGKGRPALIDSDAWNTAAYWHRQDGVFVVSGAGAAVSKSRGTVTPYDVAPTLSALLGLPVDRRMSGHVLSDFFSSDFFSSDFFAPANHSRPAPADLKKDVPVSLVATGAPDVSSRKQGDAQLEKLRSLGYLTGTETSRGPTAPRGGRPGRTEGAWNNLGLFQREKGKLAEAEASFRKSLELNPGYSSPLNNLSYIFLKQKKFEKADDELFRSVAAGNPRSEALFQNRISFYSEKGAAAGQLARFLGAAAKRFPASRVVALAEGRRRYESKDCRGSVAVLDGYISARGDDAEVLNFSAVGHLCLGDRDGAVDRFRRSLAKAPGQTVPREALRRLAVGD